MTTKENRPIGDEHEHTVSVRSETADLILAGLLIVGSVWYLWTASHFPTRGSSWAQAHTFPYGIGFLTIFACLALIMFAVIRILRQQTFEAITVGHPWRVIIGMLATFTYPVLLPWFGFYITSALFTGFFGYVAGIRKLIPLTAVTLGFLVFTKIVFENVLGTPLPTGNWL
jgi:hypothetical protein